MHQSSYDIMQKFVLDYMKRDQETAIYDIGSRFVDGGTYNGLFKSPGWNYIGVDLEAGENVHHVLKDPYQWNLANSCADVVISGQCLEHVEYFWMTMREIARIMKPSALLCLIVPSSGRIHQYPVDCWRFLPDGLKALARYADLDVLKCENPENGSAKWKDCLLIAQKPLKE